MGLVIAVSLFGPAVARANPNPTETARELGYAGVDAYEAGDYTEAERNLSDAFAILKVPSLGLWSARSMLKQGKLVEAALRLRDVVALDTQRGEVEVQREALLEAHHELRALEPRIPTLTVHLVGAGSGVSVRVNGKELLPSQWSRDYALNPGLHKVEAFEAGRHIARAVTLRESDRHVLQLDLSAGATGSPERTPQETAPHPTSRRGSGAETDLRRVGWYTLAGGGVLLAAGVTFGVIGASRLRNIRDNSHCNGNTCEPSERNTVDSYEFSRTVSLVGYISGGIVGATGLVLVLTSDPSRRSETQVVIAPNQVVLGGRF